MEYATLIPAKEAVAKGPEKKGATKAQRFFPGLPEPGSTNKKRLPLGLCGSRLYMLFGQPLRREYAVRSGSPPSRE